MSTMEYKAIVTVQDLFDAGSCQRGTRRFLRNSGLIAARADAFPNEEWIQVAANNAYGHGFGEGYGHGHGYGHDQGHDNRDGFKFGDGDSYGDEGEAGYGVEWGDGDGCGDFMQRPKPAASTSGDGS